MLDGVRIWTVKRPSPLSFMFINKRRSNDCFFVLLVVYKYNCCLVGFRCLFLTTLKLYFHGILVRLIHKTYECVLLTDVAMWSLFFFNSFCVLWVLVCVLWCLLGLRWIAQLLPLLLLDDIICTNRDLSWYASYLGVLTRLVFLSIYHFFSMT
jgi:hypothetical protein